jgi:hypothetical protein
MQKLLILVLVTAASASATIIWVNDNAGTYAPPGRDCAVAGFATIQGAVNAASAGDTINVCPGTYTENVTIDKSDLKVVSTGGAAATVVIAALAGQDVFFITRPNVTLEGFSIAPGGQFGKHDIGVTVAFEGAANLLIVHNYLRGGRIGVNLGCVSAGSTVAHNTIQASSEAGINVDTCEAPPFPGSNNNFVHHNTVCGGLYPYSIAVGGASNNNDVHHNSAIWISVGGTGNFVHHNIAELFLIAPGNTENHNTIANVCQ